MATSYWGDNEPLDGNDCAVLFKTVQSKSKLNLKSKLCESKEHFICVGKNDSVKNKNGILEAKGFCTNI